MPSRLDLAALALVLAGCAPEPVARTDAAAPATPAATSREAAPAIPALPPLPLAPSPRYDEVAQLGTHNAYWVDRGDAGDLFGSGVGERLLDQLAFDRVRALELDIHTDPARPGEFRVYHTTPGNGLCDALRDCLGELRTFAWAAPQHEVVTINLELKQLHGSNFDATHSIDDLDRLLRDELGPALYTPADLLARCPGDTTLSSCAQRARWPALADLRGRVIVALLGNWDELGAQATADWAHYATSPITARAAFPMACSWKLRAEDLHPRIAALADQAALDRALAQSVFLQVEDLADPRMPPFLAAGGIVRANGAEGVAAQEERLALGVQILQTDTPWQRARDLGPDRPMLSFKKTSAAIPPEPGRRLLLAAEPGEAVFAYAESDAPLSLRALVSAGHSTAVGCLRAATTADARDAITVCRRKQGPVAEQLTITVELCRAGACTQLQHISQEPAPGGVGDVLALETDATGCVRARSARATNRAGAPVFVDLADPWCPPAPPRLRGLFRPAAAEASVVGFFGLDLPGPVTVQLTGDGAPRTEPARLTDAGIHPLP